MRKTDARKMDREALAEMRMRAVQSIRRGESPEKVAEIFGVNRVTVYGWLNRFATGGWSGLKRRKAPGREPTLDAHQMRTLYYVLVDSTPEQMKFPFALWTSRLVMEFIRRRFHVKLSRVTVNRILARLGFSFQKPIERAAEQDASLVRKWQKEEYPRILALAKREGAEIYFGDEAGVRSDAPMGKTWGRVGKTPIVKKTGKRFGLNLVSAISPKGHARFMVTKGNFGGKEFAEFLRRLIAGTKRKVIFIADGHPAHKSALVAEYLETVKDRLRMFFLPPYSPELNPDELVWNVMKGELGRVAHFDKEDLASHAVGILRRFQKRPHEVRKLFHEKHVRYTLGYVI
jgi:transposase